MRIDEVIRILLRSLLGFSRLEKWPLADGRWRGLRGSNAVCVGDAPDGVFFVKADPVGLCSLASLLQADPSP